MTFWRRLTIQRLMVAILFILVFAMAVRLRMDTDTWWHVRSGDTIVETRSILTTDTFSHTRLGHDWVNHSWGAQIIIYGVYALFGGTADPVSTGAIGLSLLTALLATAGMAFVYAMCEGNVYVRAFMVVLGAAAAAIFWSPRPQMFSFLLGAVVLYLVHLYKREDRDRLWWIPIIMVVWVNLHGGFAIGFIFLFGTITGEVLGNLFNPEDERVIRWGRLKKLVLVTLVSIPLVAVNPNGVTMLTYPFRTVGIGVLQDFIQEWSSPDFHQPQTWPFLILLMATLGTVGLSSRRIDWADLVLVTGTGVLALSSGRNIAVFAIAATPVLSRHVNAWLTDRGWQILLRRRVTPRMAVLNWILLVLVVFGALTKIVTTFTSEVDREAQRAYYPVELAAYLADSAPAGKLFNDYNWGGYLLYAAPNVPVYVDGRTDLYDDAFLREYLRIFFAQEGWDTALDQQDIDLIVIDPTSTLAAMLRMQPDRWTEQQFDAGRSSLFVRTVRTTADD